MRAQNSTNTNLCQNTLTQLYCLYVSVVLYVCVVLFCISVLTENNVDDKKAGTNKVERSIPGLEDSVKRSDEPDSEGDVDVDDNDDKEGNDDERDEAEAVVKEEVTDLSKEELALRIYNAITSTILPQLHKCVTKKVSWCHNNSY